MTEYYAFEDNLTECDKCKKQLSKDQGQFVDGKTLCDDCFDEIGDNDL